MVYNIDTEKTKERKIKWYTLILQTLTITKAEIQKTLIYVIIIVVVMPSTPTIGFVPT
jgi:hypothetical protein